MTSFMDINWGILEIIYICVIFSIVLTITYFLSPYIIQFLRNRGYVGYDIHKKSRPAVCESGGMIIVVGLIIGFFLFLIFFPVFINYSIVFIITILIAALIGFIDDRLKLRSFFKILLTIFTGSILFFTNYFGFISISSPTIPFLGKLRLSIIYPLAVPLIVAVFANTVNMLEGYNGEGSGTCLIATIFLLICAILWNSVEAIIFAILGISVLIPFYIFNKYPARAFPGDVGTLTMGTMLACIALFGSLEAALFSALFVHVFNSFYVLSSVRGFSESSSIQETISDIILLEDERIVASDKKKAVLTLPRLLLAKGALREPELVKNIYVISICCGFFSIITTLFMMCSVERIYFPTTLIISLILLIPVIILSYYYSKIRGVILLMISLIIGGFILLITIDVYIMPIRFENLKIFNIEIPVNIIISLILLIPALMLWYLITIKYFNYVIQKKKYRENITD